MAVRGGLLIERARRDFGGEIAVEDLLHVLADMQRIEHLHIGKSVKKDDAFDELIGMLHLLDGFFAQFADALKCVLAQLRLDRRT